MEDNKENVNRVEADFLIYGCAKLTQRPRSGYNRHLYPSGVRWGLVFQIKIAMPTTTTTTASSD